MEKEKLNLKEPEKVEAYVSGEGITLTPPQPTIMLEFHKDGKYSCLDFKDGEWQFWGTMPIGKSANLFWKEVISKLAKQKTENLLLQEKAKCMTDFEKRLEEYRNSPDVWKNVGISKWKNWGEKCGYFDYLSNR